MKNWKLIISFMIIFWLGLQLWAGANFKDYTWPFIGFPMYAYKRGVTYDNEVQKILLRSMIEQGQEVEVIPEDFGMYSTPWDCCRTKSANRDRELLTMQIAFVR